MKKTFAALVIALSGILGNAGEQVNLFQNKEAWTLPASSEWKDNTLRVNVLPTNHNKRGTNTAQLNLEPEKIRGKYLRFTCEAKGENLNIAELERPYLGFKFMLIVKGEKKTTYPGGGRNAENFDWKKVSFETPIPEDVTDAKLNLGLQNISGTVYFRNVRLEIIDDTNEE